VLEYVRQLPFLNLQEYPRERDGPLLVPSQAGSFEAATAVLPMRPRSLPGPLLCDVAYGRFNFAVL
jgi:hypothetical protein